jgi:D-lactate dehydrogenase (cytochrome)
VTDADPTPPSGADAGPARLAFLRDLPLSPDQVSFAGADRDQHATDWGTPERAASPPDAVVWPESTADVSAVLAACYEHEVPVTPYAAGTSIEGNAVPVAGGVALDLLRMDDVLAVRPDDRQIDVEPGIYGDAVNEAVERHGLVLPSLPSSGAISTIGGMIANDASGMTTVRYGEVSDWVLGMEVVLPTGEVVETGSRAVKSSCGYNLGDLIVGSEGTLGVVTRATLELAGRPAQIRDGRAVFDDLDDAAAAVFDAVRSGVDVAKIELVDGLSATVANEYLGTDLPDAPMVFLEFHANHGVEGEVSFCRSIFESHGVSRFEVTDAHEGADGGTDLWAVRRELADALEPYDPDLSIQTPGDVTVPISEYPDLVTHAKRLADEHDVLLPCFGHAGDGNLHFAALVDPDDPDHVARGERVGSGLVEYAVEHGGTATGEHGVGLGKREYLAAEHGEAGVAAMRAIKRALDPKGLLNPGKILPGPDA